MSASIVLVHDVAEFAEHIAAALRTAGYTVTTFSDTMTAIDALENGQRIDVLLTRVNFAPGQPNGVALALMARVRHPGLNVLFVGLPERLPYTEGIGELLPAPATAADVVAAIADLLANPSKPAGVVAEAG